MTISIHRLRRLAEQKSAVHAALQATWQVVLSARKDLAAAKANLETYRTANGLRLDSSGEASFEAAINTARERLAAAEANHSRLHEAWELSANLARRGFDHARDHVRIPADVEEAFR